MKFPGRPRDTVPAMLRPGEGVLVPEATQMLGGARGINALNRGAEARMVRTAGRGILARHVTPPPRMPVQHFTGGGIVYDDWGHPLDSDATPSSYTSPTWTRPARRSRRRLDATGRLEWRCLCGWQQPEQHGSVRPQLPVWQHWFRQRCPYTEVCRFPWQLARWRRGSIGNLAAACSEPRQAAGLLVLLPNTYRTSGLTGR